MKSCYLVASCRVHAIPIIFVFSSSSLLFSSLKLDHSFVYAFLPLQNQTLHIQTQSFLFFSFLNLFFPIITFGQPLIPPENEKKKKKKKLKRKCGFSSLNFYTF